MEFQLAPDDLCPCDSGTKLRECCLRSDGSILPDQCKTATPGTHTGFSHPKCYANALADCSLAISKEHYLSEGVLKRFSAGAGLWVTGFPWQTAEDPRKVGTATLTSHILCERHNNALSPLDVQGIRLLASMDFLARERECNRTALFNGHDVERWLLKWLCGMVYSGNATFRNKRIDNWSPPIEWLQVLFGQKPFPENCGLYATNSVAGSTFKSGLEIRFCPLFLPERELSGAAFGFMGYEFVLAMVDHPGITNVYGAGKTAYHPKRLNIKIGHRIESLLFGYQHAPTNFEMQIERTSTGSPSDPAAPK